MWRLTHKILIDNFSDIHVTVAGSSPQKVSRIAGGIAGLQCRNTSTGR
jgi:hypothetical protein